MAYVMTFEGELGEAFRASVATAVENLEVVGEAKGKDLTVDQVLAAAGGSLDYQSGSLVFGVGADGKAIFSLSFDIRGTRGTGDWVRGDELRGRKRVFKLYDLELFRNGARECRGLEGPVEFGGGRRGRRGDPRGERGPVL
jgi:hypothetical protein